MDREEEPPEVPKPERPASDSEHGTPTTNWHDPGAASPLAKAPNQSDAAVWYRELVHEGKKESVYEIKDPKGEVVFVLFRRGPDGRLSVPLFDPNTGWRRPSTHAALDALEELGQPGSPHQIFTDGDALFQKDTVPGEPLTIFRPVGKQILTNLLDDHVQFFAQPDPRHKKFPFPVPPPREVLAAFEGLKSEQRYRHCKPVSEEVRAAINDPRLRAMVEIAEMSDPGLYEKVSEIAWRMGQRRDVYLADGIITQEQADPKNWPVSPAHLSRVLRPHFPTLERAGCLIQESSHKKDGQFWSVYWTGPSTAAKGGPLRPQVNPKPPAPPPPKPKPGGKDHEGDARVKPK